ncbi:hypothetical protein BT69DRAFT_1285040 [Atractiella rhizophila]|nr:hypothetical protein BT69DRAFT_1285040 [Atractiella rhizophila]
MASPSSVLTRAIARGALRNGTQRPFSSQTAFSGAAKVRWQQGQFVKAVGGTALVVGGVGLSLWAGSALGFPTTAYALSIEPVAPISTDRPAAAPLMRPDPSTSMPFPTYLSTASSPTIRCDLIGLGVRTVSFLGIQVYVAGFYVDQDALACLQYMPEWVSFKADKLLSASVPYHQQITENLDYEGLRGRKGETQGETRGEELIRRLVALPGEFVVRIVPTRGTDFGHLRDGFTKALMGRMKVAEKKGEIDPSLGERLANSLVEFKNLFPQARKLGKGKEMLLIKDRDGNLKVECEGELIGILKDEWIAREMIVAYFADQNVISQKMKDSVAAGFESLMRNPPKRHIPKQGFFGAS